MYFLKQLTTTVIHVFSGIYHEFLVTHALLCSNGPHVWSGFLLYLLSRLSFAQVPLESVFRLLATTFVLSTGYLYTFDLINQIMGATEDKTNKPYRPMPSGLITIQGAQLRYMLSCSIYALLSYHLSGVEALKWALFWEAWTLFNYVWPAPNSATLKSIFTGVATFVITAVDNAVIVAEHPELDSRPLLPLCLAVWITLVIHIQEFHDMEGDKKVGKQTLPLIVGKDRIFLLRQATCGLFCILHTAWLLWGLKLTADSAYHRAGVVFGIMQWVFGVTLGVLVLQARTRTDDKNNYYYGLGLLEALMVVYVALLDHVK